MATLQRSEAMEALHFNNVVRPVSNDPRTNWDDDTSIWLGYPFNVIREEVINKGLADFSVGHEHKKYGDLTADEKVLLYCFTNMTLHFFESLATFRSYKAELAPLLEPPGRRLMMDLGCGPGTAVLALAEIRVIQEAAQTRVYERWFCQRYCDVSQAAGECRHGHRVVCP